MAAFALSATTVLLATPLAILVAKRTQFYDRPVGYKAHGRPTPYLGGAAVVLGTLAGTTFVMDEWRTLLPILGGAAGLCAVGTIDDRRGLPPLYRLVVAAGVATWLTASGLGWSLSGNALIDTALTIFWVVSVVNAFNLMDNMDGAAPTVTAVCAGGVAVLALLTDETAIAALALAVSGACVAFLRYNLTRPARIFLGDGGSMPLGFLVAATVLALDLGNGSGTTAVVVAALLVALPAFDTSLVILSRLRRRVTVWTGGRDHLTHRLHTRLVSTHAVAAALRAAQMGFSMVAVLVAVREQAPVLEIAGASVVAALVAGFVLELRLTSMSSQPGRADIARRSSSASLGQWEPAAEAPERVPILDPHA